MNSLAIYTSFSFILVSFIDRRAFFRFLSQNSLISASFFSAHSLTLPATLDLFMIGDMVTGLLPGSLATGPLRPTSSAGAAISGFKPTAEPAFFYTVVNYASFPTGYGYRFIIPK